MTPQKGQSMKLIAAVTQNWGLGLDGRLLHSIPEDMAYFRAATRGAAVVMGRATLDSFPGGRPLKGRTNLVLTRSPGFAREGVQVLHGTEELPAALAGADPDAVFVIGGASVYRELLPYCDTALITKMELTLPADAFLPDLDAEPGWRLADAGERAESGGTGYRFCRYRNGCVRPLAELARPVRQE